MPTPYLLAWGVVVVAALLMQGALYFVLRDWRAPLVKPLLAWWLLFVLVVPAQVPGHENDLAPAFLVFLFEALFQGEGRAGPAGRILLAATLVAIIAGLVNWRVLLRRRSIDRSDARP
jgi:hypothetical protein